MPDPIEPATRLASRLCRIASRVAVGAVAVLLLAASDEPASQQDVAAFEPARMDLCATIDGGFLSGNLFGALTEQLEWRDSAMECGGMLRPNDAGIRLVFAAPRHDERLLIVLGIDGMLDELVVGEHATNITIVDEASKRFFSSGGRDRCWSTIDSIQPLTSRIMHVTGEVYCAGSLPSLSDNSSVALRNMRYAGRLLLDDSDQN